jgi:outer membrane lipoprotein SlyB
MFWVAPLIGGVIGGVLYNTVFGSKGKTIEALEAAAIPKKVTV